MIRVLRRFGKMVSDPRYFSFAETKIQTRRLAYQIGGVLNRETRVRKSQAARMPATSGLGIPLVSGYNLLGADWYSDIDRVVEDASGYVDQIEPDLRAERTIDTKCDPTVSVWNTHKRHLYQRPLTPDDLDPESSILRVALSPELLAGITTYFQAVPILNFIMVTYSTNNQNPESSQLYHGDGETYSQIKVFINLNDVTRENGPFTFISAGNSEMLCKRLGYRFGARIGDDEVEEYLSDSDVLIATGKPGTTLVVDTSRCLHYGSRVGSDRSRAVLMFQFLMPMSTKVYAPFRTFGCGELTAMQRMVLGVGA